MHGALLALVAAVSKPSGLRDTILASVAATKATVPELPHGSRVLVTGGAGFIGFHLAKRLHDNGMHVTVLDNMDPYYSLALKQTRWDMLSALGGVNMVEGDLCNDTLLNELHEHHGFTHVASLAGQAGVRYSLIHPRAYTHNNVHCFLSVLELVRRYDKIKLVYASSSSVYGSNSKVPFSETDRVDSPESLYAVTKKTDEAMAHVYHRLYNISVTGLRFFTVYGPWGRPDMAYFSMADRMRKQQPIELYGHGKVKRDFTYVDDIVDGIAAALALGAQEEVFNLGNHRVVNVSRFVAVLEGHMGMTARKVMVGMSPGDVPLTFANTSHAYSRLGYDPQTTIEVGLKRFVEWFNSSEYRDEFAKMEVQTGEAESEMLRVSMHKAAPQHTDDVTLPPGTARCGSACATDPAAWAEKCSYDSLNCASCTDCGVPGQLYAAEPASGFVAFSRRATPEPVAAAAAKAPFADASGTPIDFAPPGCTKGAHVVFIGSESKSGVVMRDVIMSTVLKQARLHL